jgi:hypothetical protein
VRREALQVEKNAVALIVLTAPNPVENFWEKLKGVRCRYMTSIT